MPWWQNKWKNRDETDKKEIGLCKLFIIYTYTYTLQWFTYNTILLTHWDDQEVRYVLKRIILSSKLVKAEKRTHPYGFELNSMLWYI